MSFVRTPIPHISLRILSIIPSNSAGPDPLYSQFNHNGTIEYELFHFSRPFTVHPDAQLVRDDSPGPLPFFSTGRHSGPSFLFACPTNIYIRTSAPSSRPPSHPLVIRRWAYDARP